MNKFWNSVAFRLSMMGGALIIVAVLLVSMVVYFSTVDTMIRKIDKKIFEISNNLSEEKDKRGLQSVARRIEVSLVDGIDSDVEILLLINREGKKIAGNLLSWNGSFVNTGAVIEHKVLSSRGLSESRVNTRYLNDGSFLVVGRDMTDIYAIRALFFKSTILGGGLAILLAIGAIFILRHQIEKKIFSIRTIAQQIEAGNFHKRIAISDSPDEFDRLNIDINRMLDRIEHLMDGVKNVSNVIAHNTRTPLSLIRNRLDEAIRDPISLDKFSKASEYGIDAIDRLIIMLEKMLQIAEAESGARRSSFRPVNVQHIVQPLIELYDAVAEQNNIQMTSHIPNDIYVLGDTDLLSGALMNLLDNSIKYAGPGCHIHIHLKEEKNSVSLMVEDDGPGIPASEHDKVLQRFYRMHSKGQGSGLGLAIVKAFVQMQGGEIFLEDTHPGLRVKLVFPRVSGLKTADTLT